MNELKLDVTPYREPVKDPRICTVLDVIGWVSVIIGVLLVIFGIEEPGTLSLGIAGAISGVLFLALSAIIDRLHRVEISLRK